jgi:hypothetical protein
MPRLHAAEPNWRGPEEPVPQPPQPELPPKKPSEPELPSPDPGRAPFPGPGPTDPGLPPPVSYTKICGSNWPEIRFSYSFGGSIPNAVASAI